jgi:hypothetical protein
MSIAQRLILFAVLCTIAAGAQADLKKGLVAYYRFDGNVKDSSGNFNDGVITGGVVPTQDRHGRAKGAMLFDGTGYVVVADAPSLNPKNQLTLAFWMRLDAFGGTWTSILYKGQLEGGNCLSGRQYTVWANNESFVDISSAAGEGSCTRDLPSLPFSMVGQWTHVAYVIDRRTTNKMSVYINGALQSQMDDNYTGFERTYQPLLIGATSEDYGAFPFVGALDELRVYNRALSASEIGQLYGGSLLQDQGVADRVAPLE